MTLQDLQTDEVLAIGRVIGNLYILDQSSFSSSSSYTPVQHLLHVSHSENHNMDNEDCTKPFHVNEVMASLASIGIKD